MNADGIGVWSRNGMYSTVIVLSTCSFTTALLSWVSNNVYTSCHLQYLWLCYHTLLTNLCHRSSAILRRMFFSLLWTACRWRALKQVFCTGHKKLSNVTVGDYCGSEGTHTGQLSTEKLQSEVYRNWPCLKNQSENKRKLKSTCILICT